MSIKTCILRTKSVTVIVPEIMPITSYNGQVLDMCVVRTYHADEVTIVFLPCQKMGETVPSLNCVALITKISSKHKPGLLMISVEGLKTYTPELPHFLFEYVGKLASINGAS